MTPSHVLRAAQVEYAKAERALTDSEIGRAAMTRLEIVVDELVVRGLSPEQARAAAAAFEVRLGTLAEQSEAARARARRGVPPGACGRDHG